jgi:hypothetical protein
MILKELRDIITPYELISKNLGYRNISFKDKTNIIVNNKKLIHVFDDDIDQCILHALNMYDNLNSFVLFGKNKTNAYKYFMDKLNNDYSLYGIKHITVKTSHINKIMYQLLFPRMIIKNKKDFEDFLKETYPFLYNYKDDNIDITLLVVCKRDINKKYPLNSIIESDYIMFIPNTKEEIWHTASLFFCSGSLKFIEIQNFDFFLTKDNENSKKMFLKFRKWLNINVDSINQQQFMLFSSIVLYLIGHRAMSDLDLYVHNIPGEIEEKMNEFSDNKVYDFIDFSVKGTKKWPNHWNAWLDEWSNKCGAKYFEEILANPKYHFYFLGIKVISLDCDVVRRLERNRPRAYADLIALRKRYQYIISIPPIPDTTYKYISVSDKSDEDIELIIRNERGILNKDNKEIKISIQTDISKFINTIIYALHTRYRMKFTSEEIRKELHMRIEKYKENTIQEKELDNTTKRRIKINISKK